jgi:hypothetical protein
VTAWGDGTVNGTVLPETPAVTEFRGSDIVFTGSGRISDVLWE